MSLECVSGQARRELSETVKGGEVFETKVENKAPLLNEMHASEMGCE